MPILNTNKRVALITGCNTGIGYSLVEQLLNENKDVEICMLCRSIYRAEKAKINLEKKYPYSAIEIIVVDIGDVQSILNATKLIKTKYNHIDYCFMNAGIMPDTEVDWKNFIKKLFSSHFLQTMVTAEGILHQKDKINSDGLKNIFATNIFGHFLIFRQLIGIMGHSSKTQIIWTSSSNASKKSFKLNDIQHENGRNPYSSSKYAIDLLSYHINVKFNQMNIFSHTTCPGLVMSNLTNSIIPRWAWLLIIPFLIILRVILPSMTLSTTNGAYVMPWLINQDPSQLPWDAKFFSRVSLLGKRYVETKKKKVPTATLR